MTLYFYATEIIDSDIVPHLTSSSSSSSASINSLIQVTETSFTASIVPSGFATFTIQFPVGTIQDNSGNSNTVASNQFTWIYIDNTPPQMVIWSEEVYDGDSTNSGTLSLIFQSNEDISGLTQSEIVVSGGGTISNFIKSADNAYKATFTPSSDGTKAITVPANTFVDTAAGNENDASTIFQYTYDGTSPTVLISVDDVSSEGVTSNDPITARFTITDDSSTTFDLGDVTISGATIDLSSGIITPTTDGAISISVESGTFQDAVGNANDASNIFTFTYDSTAPTVHLSSDECSDSMITNEDSCTIHFIVSESSTDFQTQASIQVFGGTLDSISGSAGMFTSTLTPDTDGTVQIYVSANSFEDEAGNRNIANSETFTFTYDSTAPTMNITSSQCNSGETTNDAALNLIFEVSETFQHWSFRESDITVTGGTISDFDVTSGIHPIATFTPNSEEGTKTIVVKSNTFQDIAGSTNTEASNTFTWIYDPTPPTLIITAAEGNSGFASSDTNLSLAFTLSEDSADFVSSSVTVVGGSLSSFEGSGSTYMAIFVPVGASGSKTISVDVGAFTDLAGGSNVVASNTFEWEHDPIVPTMTVECLQGESGFYGNDALYTFTFFSSESTTDFNVNDIRCEGGNITDFTGNGFTYTGTFYPNSDGSKNVHVNAGWYHDAAENSNEPSNTFTWTHDTTAPTVMISCSTIEENETTNLDAQTFLFTWSEAGTSFEQNDIAIVNGAISEFTQIDDTVYSVVVTNTIDGAMSISVSNGNVADVGGNTNPDSSSYDWIFDSTSPTISIECEDGMSSGGSTNIATHRLRFVSSEVTADFDESDIDVEGGTLSSFQVVNGTTYTATFTSSSLDGAKQIIVKPYVFADEAGNGNIASTTNSGNWILMFRHDSSNREFFESSEESTRVNEDDPSASKFSILDELEELGNTDGTYEFKMTWPEFDQTNHWTQRCNPVLETCRDTNGQLDHSYVALNVSQPYASGGRYVFVGLIPSSVDHTFLDGVDGNAWFYSIGSRVNYGCTGCQPTYRGLDDGYTEDEYGSVVELYVFSHISSFDFVYVFFESVAF